ncbi:hypothetical protein BJV82DRAFT_616672 [Fennellomyces sp. T-0311]|nr:hypothetical protein BJV82DRAFT_616672 [Fennellomyces sp. T-0311]
MNPFDQHEHPVQQQPPLSPRASDELSHDFPICNQHNSSSDLERKTLSITPPLDEIEPPISIAKNVDESDQPMAHSYLLNLFTAPDMRSYLSQANFTEDVYALPIHLQRLISEAKEEMVLARTKELQGIPTNTQGSYSATQRLERLRSYVWARSGHDISGIMKIILELVEDEDELVSILNNERYNRK